MNASLYIKIPLSYPLYSMHKIKKLLVGNEDILILMYHRVINNVTRNVLLQDAMYVNVNTFEKQIIYTKNNYDIVSLETIGNVLKDKVRKKRKKPLCCITFDDGWKDFYENAYSLLKKYQVCATVFLPTDFIGTNRQFWTDMLATVISGINTEELKLGKAKRSPGDLLTEIERICESNDDRLEKAIDLLKKIPLNDIESIIIKLGEKWKINYKNAGRSFLTWEEVMEMHQSRIVNFGSHTVNHKILTSIQEKEIWGELIKSKEKLLSVGVVSESFIPFAYPNGNHTDRIAKIVKEAGYSLALATTRGWNGISNDIMNLYKLKRVGIHEDMTSTNAMFACRLHGYY